MPDIGWMELMVIGIVALIVVGPKDLPKLFLKLGQMTGRVRAMAKDFSNAMNEAAGETGMTELNRDLRKAGKFTNPKAMAKDMMGDVMDDIDPTKFEEGSATRVIAEKKAAAQAEARQKAEALRASRAAEMSHEPEEGAPEPAAADTPVSPKAEVSKPAAKQKAAKPKAAKTAARKPAARKPAAKRTAAKRAPVDERADPGPANVEAPAETRADPEPQADGR